MMERQRPTPNLTRNLFPPSSTPTCITRPTLTHPPPPTRPLRGRKIHTITTNHPLHIFEIVDEAIAVRVALDVVPHPTLNTEPLFRLRAVEELASHRFGEVFRSAQTEAVFAGEVGEGDVVARWDWMGRAGLDAEGVVGGVAHVFCF